MRVAIPLFGSVVSPRFEFAREMLVASCADGGVVEEMKMSLPPGRPHWRVALLAEMGVTVVICGGVSPSSGRLLASHGIEVISFATGPAGGVLEDFINARFVRTGRAKRIRRRSRRGGRIARGRAATGRPGRGRRREGRIDSPQDKRPRSPDVGEERSV
jgi:predicted Fe-Mo cluster-binding NifX family protein